ncbi:MAG: MBL fold metallo-hydrolase, partial [Acetobacteraceae bacterium]
NRRKILEGTLGGLLGATSLAAAADAVAQAAPAAAKTSRTAGSAAPPTADVPLTARTPHSIVRLNEKMAVVSGGNDNVLALASGAGLLLVDSGSPAYTKALLAALHGVSGGGRVHTLINTHWHPDQTGSNAAFGEAGARIIAQHKTRNWIAVEHYDPAANRYVKGLPRPAWPTQTFFERGSMTAGAEHIEYGHLPEAHTDGDCYVYFRDSNVLAAGHAVSPAQDPQLDWYAGGWLGGRLVALRRLHDLANDETKIVPAFGPVVARSAVKAEHDMLAIAYQRMVALVLKGYSAEDIFRAGVLKGLGRTFSDPRTFVYSAFKGMWGHEDALSATIL